MITHRASSLRRLTRPWSRRRRHSLPANILTEEEQRDHALRHIESAFRDSYLNLISIIQGVAYGYIAAALLTPGASISATSWLRASLCALLVVIVWQEYMVGATVFAWVPTLLDTLVPFGIGALEFAAISRITGPLHTFFLIIDLVWFAGVIAYTNLLFHARRGFAVNRHTYPIFGRYVRFGLTMSVIGATIDTTALAMWDRAIALLNETALILLGLAPFCVLAVHSIWDWNVKLRSIARDRRIS